MSTETNFSYNPVPGQKESLHEIFRQLHAWRVEHLPPEQLKVNVDQRQALVDEADPDQWIKAGDLVHPFSVQEVDGPTLTLDGLLERGPLVLVFFRFEGCPACNLALPYYQRNLFPQLQALGATLLALSPQVPEKLVEIKRRHALGFHVATDRDNALGRRFGILYTADEASQQAALARGRTTGETTGTGTWQLPQPTVVVIDTERRVRFADVHPDWLLRTEAEPVLASVEALLRQPVAA
ncbi:peroxiredoxin-like family protein [Pelomonas sp. KK5]|uniref:peroxiredoxin-like family protein n=1 Tax=Pelomonas sp. KK5 TaxID=1855730 RepID=UPI00097BBD88|nr:peroxiredoxin-like family protein [Pelomonas sp. KK5]